MNHGPAKVTRPRPLRVLPRMRLFRVLDRARQCPVVWVKAPPGAGKTTLISNYLDQRRLRNLWYQGDEGDADVATLFHYLGLALRKLAPRSRKPLPQLSLEYGPNPNAFYRLFFQALFGRSVDVQELEQLFAGEGTGQSEASQIFALYRGAFLEKESDASWMWPRRERLRNGFLRELARHGHRLTRAGQTEDAIRLYEKGLQVDGVAEEFYHTWKC